MKVESLGMVGVTIHYGFAFATQDPFTLPLTTVDLLIIPQVLSTNPVTAEIDPNFLKST